jgi:hypothetical protein
VGEDDISPDTGGDFVDDAAYGADGFAGADELVPVLADSAVAAGSDAGADEVVSVLADSVGAGDAHPGADVVVYVVVDTAGVADGYAAGEQLPLSMVDTVVAAGSVAGADALVPVQLGDAAPRMVRQRSTIRLASAIATRAAKRFSARANAPRPFE